MCLLTFTNTLLLTLLVTKCMEIFSLHQAILCDTNWLSCKSTPFCHCLPGDSFRSHWVRVQSCRTAPSLSPPLKMPFAKAQVVICASDQMTIDGRIQQPPNSINLLEWLTELRGTFYFLDHQFFTKGYNSRTARWKRGTGHGKGKGHRASMLSPGTPVFPNIHVSTNQEALQILPLWGFMEVLLQRID